MNRSRLGTRSTLACLVTMSLGSMACEDTLGPTPAEELDLQPAFASAALRPMRMVGTVAPVGEVVPPPPGCVLSFITKIRLRVTHMGRVDGDGQTCVLSLTPDPDPSMLPPGPPPYATAPFTASWVLVAANGDQLRLEGFDSEAVLGLETGSLRARGKFRIVGGTGRFEGATGEVNASSVNHFGQPADEFESRGWIRY